MQIPVKPHFQPPPVITLDVVGGRYDGLPLLGIGGHDGFVFMTYFAAEGLMRTLKIAMEDIERAHGRSRKTKRP